MRFIIEWLGLQQLSWWYESGFGDCMMVALECW